MQGGEPVNNGKNVAPAKEKVASMAKENWMSSTATHCQLDRLSDAVYLPPSVVAFARFPVTVVNNDSV